MGRFFYPPAVVMAETFLAPAFFNTRAASSRVEPVVATSSMRIIFFPVKLPPDQEKQAERFARLFSSLNLACGALFFILDSPGKMSMLNFSASCCASNSD